MKKNSKPGKKEILPRDGVRKSPKKKIRLAKGHFKMLLENVLDYAIFMLDAKGQIISWSPGAQRLLGYENKDILGKHFSIFYSREDAQKKKPERQLKLALKIGRSEDEGWRIRKDGGKFWANAIITPIHNKKGKLLGFSQVTHDLTWRKRAEDELLKSREALLEGQRLSHLGSWTWNIVADDLVCSDEVFRIFGLKPGEIEPSYSLFIKFLHPDDSLRVDKAVHDALENNASYELECRILTPRGEIRHLQTHGEVFRNSKGKAVRMTGSVLDITERKQNEEALRLSEEQFSTAFENAAIGMAIVALDGKWLKVNRALCTLTGYTAEELSKKTFQDITHPDDLEKDLKNVDLLLDGKISSYDMEKRYFNKAGHIVWVLLSGTLVRDAEGKPLHFIAQIQDITWRRKAEEELRIAFERMEVATRAAKVGIWDMDYTTGKLSWDDQMYLFYGVEKGQPHENCERWEKSIHPEDCARVFQEVEDALKGIKSFESEFRIIRENDKSVRTIRAVGTVLRDERGEPLRMIGSNVDVTRERGREEALANALIHEKELVREAKTGERTKGEFLAIMSHEIRTPMNGILGYAELLSHANGLTKEHKEFTDIIAHSGETLLRILDDILDFSRLEAGRLQIEKVQFSPREVVEDIRAIFSPAAAEKGLRLHVAVAEDVPIHVEGDAGRVRQVLLNLAGNAVKFTNQGEVTLRLSLSEEASSSDTTRLVFRIKDTGCGIPQEKLAIIFEPFVQGDSGVSRRHGGSGLGLAITQHLTELMEGRLSVYSKEGKGSEFLVTLLFDLPMHSVAHSDEISSLVFDESFCTRHPLRILVVEDDRINLKLLLTFLKKLGYDALFASNGFEALKIYQEERPDCIFMDVQMPGMDGITAAQEIRRLENASGNRTPFISALTANIFPNEKQRCADVGMNFYLNKPVNRGQLASTLVQAAEFIRAQRNDGPKISR